MFGSQNAGNEVVVLTQNGRPRWAMVDYEEWNVVACEQERMDARSILETEAREAAGDLHVLSADEWRARLTCLTSSACSSKE